MSESRNAPLDADEVAKQIAVAVDREGVEYAIGGAIALGYWAQPRGTVDVDITLFVPPEQPSSCVRLLQSIGCSVQSDEAVNSIVEHGFCQVQYGGRRVDVFVSQADFYEAARQRRRKVELDGVTITIWDASTLCVFKMMFFRPKDLTDVRQLLEVQGAALDRDWIQDWLIEMYGQRDPRVSQWKELAGEAS